LKIRILVLGIGNEVAGDDIIGILAVREVAKIGPKNIDYKQISVGGLQLLETILGYDKVIIVDSIETDSPTKRILKLDPDEFNSATFLASPHDMNFPTALQLGKTVLPASMPEMLKIIGIEIPIQQDISENVTEETLVKLPLIKQMILEEIQLFLEEE
jgi:hydrogenase maturation protease